MNRLLRRTIVRNCLLLFLPLSFSLATAQSCYALSYAYVPNEGDNTVSVINTVDRSVAAPPLTAGQGPHGVAIAPAADYFYVVNSTDNNVSQWHVATGLLETNHPTGLAPTGVAVSPDSASVYVTNHGEASLSVIHLTDPAPIVPEKIDLTSTPEIPFSATPTPFGVAVHPGGNQLYVTEDSAEAADHLLVVDLTSKVVSRTYTVGDQPKGVAVTSTGLYVVVANYASHTVSVVNTFLATVATPIDVGVNPFGVAITPDNKYAYVTNSGADSVAVIDLAALTATPVTITVGNNPKGVAVTPNGQYVYVVNSTDNTVSVIATADNTIADTITVGTNPIAFGRFIGGPVPAAPTGMRATLLSDTTIALNWTDNANDELGYRLERKKYSQGGYVTIASLGPDTTSYVNLGLDYNANYFYRVAAFNDEGSSAYSNEAFATTHPEDYGGCFIATAAYGSMMEPQVQLLRAFRDRFLRGNAPGQAFIRFYYENSPPLARYIAAHEAWRLVVRWCLLPLVGLSWLALAFGVAPVLLVLGSLLLGLSGLFFLKNRARRGETI